MYIAETNRILLTPYSLLLTIPIRELTNSILFTDYYQLTMAHVYYRMGMHNKTVLFDYFFRSYPNYGTHQAGYCVFAGLETLLEWINAATINTEEIIYLKSLKSRAGTPLFEDDFIEWLKSGNIFGSLIIKSVSEGRVVHPHVPLTVIEAPLSSAQVLESALLNILNYQTLIATKASRIRGTIDNNQFLEFGLRRGQGRGVIDGTRGALIGGADFTSNVLASSEFHTQPKGTHAHSMVQAFIALGYSEYDAFKAYADIYPDDCVLLVDTINTLESGIPNAIKIFELLRKQGHQPLGIRLDSGDLAYLSIKAAEMLNNSNFPEVKIVLSNMLDELVIWQILTQIKEESPRYGIDAGNLIRRLIFGVGTKLITSEGAPALDGVYKLAAIKDGANWLPAIKKSETVEKIIDPGAKQVWRLYDNRNKATADLITLAQETPDKWDHFILRHPSDEMKMRHLSRKEISGIEPLLKIVFENGNQVNKGNNIPTFRESRVADLEQLDEGIKRLLIPHTYHVSLSQSLWELKHELIKNLMRL